MATTVSTPVGYGPVVGLNVVQVIGPNPSRTALLFYNPGPNQVAICPINPAQLSQLVPSIGGAGSITLSSQGTAEFDTLICTAGWQAIAAMTGSPLTIYEA